MLGKEGNQSGVVRKENTPLLLESHSILTRRTNSGDPKGCIVHVNRLLKVDIPILTQVRCYGFPVTLSKHVVYLGPLT